MKESYPAILNDDFHSKKIQVNYGSYLKQPVDNSYLYQKSLSHFNLKTTRKFYSITFEEIFTLEKLIAQAHI